MANPEHLESLRSGAKYWNAWRNRTALREVDLTDADLGSIRLRGANLGRADFSGANIDNADLSGANLKGADFTNASMGNTNFRGAKMIGATLASADAMGSDFTGVNLNHAFLLRAHLACADFKRATMISAVLTEASLAYSDFTAADLTGADLTECVLVAADLTRARLDGCRVYGTSIWRTKLSGTSQRDLVITTHEEPTITVDNIEVAQFLYMLLDNSRLRSVIDTLTARAVLILGRFTPARKRVLDAIHQELRRRGYVPILFDFDRSESRDLTETVLTIAGMSRFVIADLTDLAGREWRPGSVQQEVTAIKRTWESVPIQPVIEKGQVPWSMFPDLMRGGRILPPYEYSSLSQLISELPERIVDPAEHAAEVLRRELESVYSRAGII